MKIPKLKMPARWKIFSAGAWRSLGTAIVYGTPQAYSLFYSLRLMGYNATLLEGDWWKETKWAVSNVK